MTQRPGLIVLFIVSACSYAPLPMLGGGSIDAAQPDAAPVTSCTPNTFVDCYISSARICNSTGDGVVQQDCGEPGCNMAAQRCNQCTPDGAFCSGNDLVQCGADGLPSTSQTCTVGCGSSPSAHCERITPSYTALASICDTKATATSMEFTANTTLTTFTASTCNGGTVSQAAGGPAICVLHYGTIKIDGGVTVTVQGNTTALALVADDALIVDGTLDLSASGTSNGPGGGTVASGGPGSTIGGGGAGFHTPGGPGGNATTNGGAANGGAAIADPSTLSILVAGTQPQDITGVGGGGGGAAALISCQGTVTVSATATIAAGGGGGAGGYDTNMTTGSTAFAAAWGGGTGGNVVFEGMAVKALGKFFANGGSGGGATTIDNQFCCNGTDALNSTSAAAGGSSAGTGGAGGAGGTGTTAPGAGGKGPSGSAGGGGGSVGFFQTFTPTGVTPTITPAAASPSFQPNHAVEVK